MHTAIVTGTSAVIPGHPCDWQQALRNAVRDPAVLCEALGLPPPTRVYEAARQFQTLVPWEFIRRMAPGDPNDPLLRQVLPRDEESLDVEGFSHDAVGDGNSRIEPGLLQKYAGRALLVVNGTCAAHCRYCFRRHFPYVETGPRSWNSAFEHLRRSPEVEELILSGGDPLTLVDARFEDLLQAASEISHLRRIRIHTRLPILIPQRVTDALVAALLAVRPSLFLVVHINHPQEIDEHVADALIRLRKAGIPLLNQAVLLKGINDDIAILESLCRRLVDLGVLPYYLHQMDRVAGAAHFETPVELGQALIAELRRRLPGYAVPRFVQEVAGEPHKRVLA